MSSDTIFAISSGRGIAGVAVIRVSGPGAADCLRTIAGDVPEARRAVLRTFRDGGRIIDRGLALWLPGPKSFTGEDCAEFHVHGSAAVLDAMCAALALNARPAEAGEFTRRAFINGRMDLVEAEGLADLLSARTQRQKQQALHHMLGDASKIYEAWRTEMISLLARVEAAVDFAEEADVAAGAMRGVREGCEALAAAMRKAMEDWRRAAAVREGIVIVLAGAPNTGKSSLLNALAGKDVAIVSAKAGTTRDVVGADMVIAGVPVVLRDTAGLRMSTDDEIEAEGMARTRREMAGAQLRLWVSAPDILGSEPVLPIDSDTIWVENKSDLSPSQSIRERNDLKAAADHHISALTGAGLPVLRREIEKRVTALCGAAEPPAIVRARHMQAVADAVAALDRMIDSDTSRIEIIGEELRRAGYHLGRVTGRIDVEDLLDSIFASFCIGK